MASGVAGWPQEMPRQIWNRPGPFTRPSSRNFLASSRWPVSNTSSSGVTPASLIASAIAFRCVGVLTNTRSPMLRLPMSSEQISGLSSMTCCTRSAGPRSTESALGFDGSFSSWKKRAPGPGGQVDEDVGVLVADALDRLPVERLVHAGLGGLGIAHVDVHDRGARLGGVEAGVGDLLGRHRNRRVAAGGVRRPGHRTGNHHLTRHIFAP